MKKSWLLIPAFLFVSVFVHAQQPDTLIHKLDSLQIKADSAGVQKNNINPAAYNENTRITFPGYFILLGSDFKQQITAPFHLTGHTAIKPAGLRLLLQHSHCSMSPFSKQL